MEIVDNFGINVDNFGIMCDFCDIYGIFWDVDNFLIYSPPIIQIYVFVDFRWIYETDPESLLV